MLWDATIQSLPGWLFKHWHNIKCLADSWGEIPSARAVARHLGMRPFRAEQIIRELLKRGVLTELPTGCYVVRVSRKREPKERTSVSDLLKIAGEITEDRRETSTVKGDSGRSVSGG
jgi:hypothetical protein